MTEKKENKIITGHVYLKPSTYHEGKITCDGKTYDLFDIVDKDGTVIDIYDCYRLDDVRLDVENGVIRIFPGLLQHYLEIDTYKKTIKSLFNYEVDKK